MPVKLNVGFSALGPGILGSTGSITNVAYVCDVRTALQASEAGNLDSITLGNLPNTRASSFIGGRAIDALISAPKATGFGVETAPLTRVLDANASGKIGPLGEHLAAQGARLHPDLNGRQCYHPGRWLAAVQQPVQLRLRARKRH